jgi:hypothetical protein
MCMALLRWTRDRPAPSGHYSNEKVPARYNARAGCLKEPTMSENATQWFEPDASNASQQPTTETVADIPARIYDDEGARNGTPTCVCCGEELAASYVRGGDVAIKHSSFGCFSEACSGTQGGATYVFVTGKELSDSERQSRYRNAKNTGWCDFEEDDNGDTVRDDDGNAVKKYHHRFAGPQSPASVANLVNDTYPVGEYVVQRTDTKEATVTLPASASATDADRLAARYAVNGETWPAFDVEVHGEQERPQVIIRRLRNVNVKDALEANQP